MHVLCIQSEFSETPHIFFCDSNGKGIGCIELGAEFYHNSIVGIYQGGIVCNITCTVFTAKSMD